MTEQQLRALVREAIARHLGAAPGQASGFAPGPRIPTGPRIPSPGSRVASHQMFRLDDGAVNDGPCIIEPAVMCNHCGYCKSYGH